MKMPKSMQRKTFFSDLSLLSVAVIWGSGFIATQMAIDSGMGSGLILLFRFTIAAAIIFVFFHKHVIGFTGEELLYGGITGLLLFISFYAQTVGLSYTTPSNNAFLTATNVIMVPFITWAFCKHRPPARVFFSAVACLTGIGVLTYSTGVGFMLNRGDGLTVLCAFLFACHIAFLGVSTQKVSTQKLMLLQMIVAALLSAFAFLLFEKDGATLGSLRNGLPVVVYLGIFSTCIAFFVQTRAQKHTSPAKAAVIMSTEALFGSLFSVMLGYDRFTPNLLVGGFIVVASILILEL